jgi:predicted transcriptional regulator/transcriptional regulator with XRE-family HTH domain
MRAPIGQRIRKRRQEMRLSQAALAAEVGISASYLNLIEHNRRTIGGALLHRIAERLALDSRALAGTEEARLIAELAEVFGDAAMVGLELGQDDARDVVATSPVAARAILALFRALQAARVRSDMIGERLGEESFLAEASNQMLALITTVRSYAEILEDYGDLTEAERSRFIGTLVGESERLAASASDMFEFLGGRGRRRPRPSAREEIEDFISDRANHFPRLEAAAEATAAALGHAGALPSVESLALCLARDHGVTVRSAPGTDTAPSGERYDASLRLFSLSDSLPRRSVRFRLARLLGSLAHRPLLDEIAANAALSSSDATARLRRALASYFAAALLMPYPAFVAAAEAVRHDLARLGAMFDASFEQVCHRLATLRRPGAEGVPIHFLRTDIAGNISKRFSGSGLRLPRYGSACSRWVIHDAFTAPGRIVAQVAELPDGERFLLIARAEVPAERFGQCHSVMIGAAVAHASRFVYADGIDLAAPTVATPVGVTCRQCPREECTARAAERIDVAHGLATTAG